MKKVIFLILTTIFTIHLAFGCPVDPTPFEYTQPDGTKVTLRCRGDEYGKWTETANSDIVVKNDQGYYEYATIANGEIVASGIKVRDNAKNTLTANKKISSKISGYFNSEANTSGMMHTVNMTMTMTWTATIPKAN